MSLLCRRGICGPPSARRAASCALVVHLSAMCLAGVLAQAARAQAPEDRLFAGMPELFTATGGGMAPTPTELYDTHHFAWAIAVDCRRSAVGSGALSSARSLLGHLLRAEAIAAPGDLVCVYPFGNANLRSQTQELSLIGEQYRRQLRALRGCVPSDEAIRRWDTLAARGGRVDAGSALQASALWLAGEYRRGWRHLGLIVLTDDIEQLAAERATGPQRTVRPYEAADFGLPGGAVDSAYLVEGKGRLACAWLVASQAGADDVDRISCATGQGRLTTRKGLRDASLPGWGAIRGTVRGADGGPAPSLWVSAGRGLTAASSPTNGTYEILVPGPGRYVVTVADASWQSVSPFLIAALAEQATTADGLDFSVRQAPTGLRVDGFALALDKTGDSPASAYRGLGVRLLSQGTRAEVASAVTDAQGRYAFEGLSPGAYVVSACAAGRRQEVACNVFAQGRRVVAPALALPVPKPWWPLPAAIAGAALAATVLLRAALRSSIVVMAPAEGSEGGVRHAYVGPLSRVVWHEDPAGHSAPVAMVAKAPFGRPRVTAARGAEIQAEGPDGPGRRIAVLSSSVVVEMGGRRWRIAAVDTRRRHAIPDPGGERRGDVADVDPEQALGAETTVTDLPASEPVLAQAAPPPEQEPGPDVTAPPRPRRQRGAGDREDPQDWEL